MEIKFSGESQIALLVFEKIPYPTLLLSTDLAIIGCNEAYLQIADTEKSAILDKHLFDVYPENLNSPEDTPQWVFKQSLQRAIESKKPDLLMFVRYSLPRYKADGIVYEEHYWNIVNTPVLEKNNEIQFIIHNPIDVTELRDLKNAVQIANAAYDLSTLTEGLVFHQKKSFEEKLLALEDERARLRRIFEQAPSFIAVVRGPKHIHEIVNQAYCNLVGKKDLIGKSMVEALPELAKESCFARLNQVYRTGEAFSSSEIALTIPVEDPALTSETKYIDLLLQPLFSGDGAVSGIFIHGQDITARKHAQEQLNISNERWKLAIEGARDGVWDWNIATNEVIFSKRWKEILGYEDDEISNRFEEWESRVHPEDLDVAYSALQSAFEGMPYSCEHRMRTKDGRWKWVLARGRVVDWNDQGKPRRMTGTVTDISDKKESEELIWRHASFDALTGLPNRRLFRDRLEQEIRRAHHSGRHMALLFIDLDRFKEVNDLLGHDAGDFLLKEVAQRLRSIISEEHTIARLGGDEFTVILPELSDKLHTEIVAQQILSILSAPIAVKEEITYVSASIGITLYPQDAIDPEELMRNADQAMYAAKNAGRGQFRYFTRSMQREAKQRIQLIRDLRNALSENQLEIYFQPIVNLHSHEIAKAEALIRWNHPKLGFICPSQFISIAEECGLIHEIGDWIFVQAIFYSKLWNEKFKRAFDISINRSPIQFLPHPGKSKWKKILQESGLPQNSISIEITEGVLLNASSNVANALLEYRDAGIQVALDDFGTGYSSMSYLMKFDIDFLKIDQSFVHNIENNNESRTIAESMIVMAHKLGLKVIAEGIESSGQEAILREAGCDYGQGYLYSKAVPPTVFEEILLKNHSISNPIH